MVKKLFHDFDALRMYLHPNIVFQTTMTQRIVQSHPKSVDNCSVYIIFACSHDAVSKLCRLEFHSQYLPFSNLLAKNVPFSSEREAYTSHFHRFLNLPCERSLSL